MGQIEIKGSKVKELVPNIIELNIDITVYKFEVEDTENNINLCQEELKQTVVDLANSIESIDSECSVSFDNLTFSKAKPLNNKQVKVTFGVVSNKNLINLRASTIMSLKITNRNEENIVKILMIILKSANITDTYYSTLVSDLEQVKLDLTAEVCKKCRRDAETIVTSLGSEIVGVSKIVYNTSGSLLDVNKKDKGVVSGQSNPFDNFIDDDDYDDFTFNGLENIYDTVWAKGFAKTILDAKYSISDSVTVVFDIK